MVNISERQTRDMQAVPNEPFFADIFRHVQDNPSAIIVRDVRQELEISRERLLQDVLIFHDKILARLGDNTRSRLLQHNEDVFICILLPPSYGFLVAFLAIIGIGAAAVPLCQYLSLPLRPFLARY